MEQRSAEWFAAKLGKVGASRIADIMAKTKTGYSASRANYLAELLCERLTGVTADSYESAAMVRGREMEPEAIANYEFLYSVRVEPVGFVPHPKIEMAGASPDGLVGKDGLVEIKCPLAATHIQTLLTDNVPGNYWLQMQFQMAVTDRWWCDYVSYNPQLPPQMQVWVRRVYRDKNRINEIEAEVISFLAELDAKVEALRSRYLQEAAE